MPFLHNPDEWQHLKVMELDVDDECLSETFDIDFQRLTPGIFPTFTCVQVLRLGLNSLGDMQDDKLIIITSGCPQLIEIWLQGMDNITDSAIDAMVCNCPLIQIVSLCDLARTTPVVFDVILRRLRHLRCCLTMTEEHDFFDEWILGPEYTPTDIIDDTSDYYFAAYKRMLMEMKLDYHCGDSWSADGNSTTYYNIIATTINEIMRSEE